MKKIMRNAFIVVTALSAVSQLSGCATRQVALQYSSSMSPPAVSCSPTVRIGDFKDTRSDRSLGCVRNGFGMKLADVAAKPGGTSVPQWILTALYDELKRAGCSIAPQGSGNEARFTIIGEVQRVYVDSYMRMMGEMSVALCVKNGDRTVLSQLYHAEASKMNWWSSSQEFQQTLDMTLQDLMKTMVPDVVSTMSMNNETAPVTAKNPSASPQVAVKPIAPPETLSVAEPVVQAEPTAPAAAVTPKTTVDIATQLKKLKELKDLGLVTEEEYEAKRKELVGKL